MKFSRRHLLGASLAGSASIVVRPDAISGGRKEMGYRTLRELVTSLRERRVSAAELVDGAIERILRIDGRLNAVVVRDFDRAREQARAADAALAQGDERPLLGIPLTVKEAFNVAGLPTTWGIPGTEKIPVTEDAVVVARLKAAGAIVIGKTNVPVMLADWQTANPIYGVTNNPWDVARTPGGSSGGGAVALAAGYVPLEFGSDLAGSLRTPAHFCGVFAHKPTHGIVPMRGFAPPGTPALSVAPSVDLAVVGPMARSADDLMLALDVTAGPDDRDATAVRLSLPPPRHAALKDYRVLVLDSHPLLPTENAIRTALADLAGRLRKIGCRVGQASPALPDLATIGRVYVALLMAFIGGEIPDAEYAAAAKRAASLPREDESLATVGARALVSTHRDWIMADRRRAALAHQWRAFFRDWDVVLCPVMPTVAFPHDFRDMAARDIVVDGARVNYGDQSMWISIATLTGQPATAMPIGTSDSGLPIGMQIIGPYLEDRTTIAFAALAERELGGFTPPPL
jgi:amidase